MQAILPSYTPPRLAPEKAHLINCLCTRPRMWQTPFGQSHAIWELRDDTTSFPVACEVEFQVNGHAWTACFSDDSLLLLHPVLASNEPAFSVDELPVEVRSAVLRVLLTAVTDELQNTLKAPISIGAIRFATQTASVSPLGVGVQVKLTACPGIADQILFLSLIPGDAAALTALVGLLNKIPSPTVPQAAPILQMLPLELAFESGYLDLNVQEAQALEIGDVLLPEKWHAAEGRLIVRLCSEQTPSLAAFCSFADGKAVLEAPLSPEVEPDMANSEHNDIDIRLSFELDRTVITLGDLSALTPGYIFPLGCDAQTPVTVRANGKAIARGRLVDMDGTLGVQLSEIL